MELLVGVVRTGVNDSTQQQLTELLHMKTMKVMIFGSDMTLVLSWMEHILLPNVTEDMTDNIKVGLEPF